MIKADLIVVGAGAAGCFGAIKAAEHFPDARIIVLEKSTKVLSKVKISGGGRCNVTNVITKPDELSKNYPRGERFLKKAFYEFSSSDMKDWLASKGVKLRLYPDGCFFPESNDSQTIIDCFLKLLDEYKVPIHSQQKVTNIEQTLGNEWLVVTDTETYSAKAVLFTVGGQPKIAGFEALKSLNLKIVDPLPSLFTFNMPGEGIKALMGIVTEKASVKIAGEKWSTSGPLLITHWGMSGPAVLKCSAFGARILAEKGYNATILVNWTGELKANECLEMIQSQRTSNKLVLNVPLFGLKSRLWEYLLQKIGFSDQLRWSDLGPKQSNRLAELLVNDAYKMEGKTTFKEEFVTAGGVDLNEIDVKTMQAKNYPGLFFAGEAMDIDGITGGFNFQAAWTTAFIAGKNCLT